MCSPVFARLHALFSWRTLELRGGKERASKVGAEGCAQGGREVAVTGRASSLTKNTAPLTHTRTHNTHTHTHTHTSIIQKYARLHARTRANSKHTRVRTPLALVRNLPYTMLHKMLDIIPGEKKKEKSECCLLPGHVAEKNERNHRRLPNFFILFIRRC